MKKLINHLDYIGLTAFAIAGLFAIANIAQVNAQTLSKTETLASANADACANVNQPKTCTDQEHLAAFCAADVAAGKPCVDTRAADNKVYSTFAALSSATIEPEQNKARFIRLQDRTLAQVLTVMRTDPVKCAAIIAAAGKGDPTICKP